MNLRILFGSRFRHLTYSSFVILMISRGNTRYQNGFAFQKSLTLFLSTVLTFARYRRRLIYELLRNENPIYSMTTRTNKFTYQNRLWTMLFLRIKA